VRFVYTREVAEDIVGDLFYQLWKSGIYTTIQHSYRTYLYAAVRHRAYNYLRDELTGNRTPSSLDDITDAGLDETPQTLIEYDETFQRVEKVIHELPPQCQRIFLMSRFENRKNQEIADEIGFSTQNRRSAHGSCTSATAPGIYADCSATFSTIPLKATSFACVRQATTFSWKRSSTKRLCSTYFLRGRVSSRYRKNAVENC